MIIISGSSNKELAQKIANNLQERPTPCILDKFSDGEIQVDIQNVAAKIYSKLLK